MAASRVLVCDDAPGYRLLLETVLVEAGFDVVATAQSFAEAEGFARDLAPDVILLDLWLPEFDLEAIKAVRAAAPAARLAVVSSLSAVEAAELVAEVEGIDAVLSKRDAPDAIAARVIALSRGEPPTAVT